VKEGILTNIVEGSHRIEGFKGWGIKFMDSS